jgi:hypothetical protein
MIPSSPRLVAFAQSECDLTTPIVSWEQKPLVFSTLRGPIARLSIVNELAFPSFPVSRFAFADTRAPSQRGDCRYLCRRYIWSTVLVCINHVVRAQKRVCLAESRPRGPLLFSQRPVDHLVGNSEGK